MFWELIFTYETLKHIAISLAIFLLFLFLRKIFAKYVFAILVKLTSKTSSELFSQVILAFEKPMQWLFIIIGIYVSVKYFPLFDQKNLLFSQLIRSAIILLVIWGLFNLSSSSSFLFRSVQKRYNFDTDKMIIPLLSKALRFIIMAIGAAIIADEFGYNINGFVAGLGLGGLAISLAAKDALANLFGGIIIITEKPFTIGQWIQTPSVEGIVEGISFRSTKIRTFAQAIVTVPNNTLANEPITNWSKMGKGQITFRVQLPQDTPREVVEKRVNEMNGLLKNHPEIHEETAFAVLDELKESGLEIYIHFFTKTTVWEEYLKVKEDINYKMMDILEEEDAQIALPSSESEV